MAIAPTGDIYKALSFDNTTSRNYGVYITGEAVYNAPEREVEMITIPGRNGAFALDHGRFENIEVSYPASIAADTEADFVAAISEFRNFLCSKKGYCRLSDDYNPNEYRMAVYKSGLEVDPKQLRAGDFTITFDCKPQRFLTSGESAVSVASGGTMTNPTLFESSPLLAVKGYGTVGFNGYEIEFDNAMLGPVVIFDGDAMPWDATSINIASPLYNTGDTITIPADSSRGIYLQLLTNLSTSTYLNYTDSPQSVTGGRITRGDSDTKLGVVVQVYMSDMTITAGTDSSKTDTISGTFKYANKNSQQTVLTSSLTVSVTRTYDASANTITWTWTYSDTGSKFVSDSLETCTCKDITADSTLSILGNPTYIDCDLGAAYKYENGEVVSLNAHIDLGSNLPKLAPGSNTVTYDNTYTEVKVIPRWWKV